MKGLLLLLSFVIISFTSSAQALVATNSPASVVNTTPVNSTFQAFTEIDAKSIQVVALLTKTSGTLSGGTIALFGSLDGTNWISVADSVYTITSATTQLMSWNVNNDYTYLKVVTTAVGTNTSTVAVRCQARRKYKL